MDAPAKARLIFCDIATQINFKLIKWDIGRKINYSKQTGLRDIVYCNTYFIFIIKVVALKLLNA